MYAYVCLSVCMCVSVYGPTFVYQCVSVHMSVCQCLCGSACVSVLMLVSVYVYVCINVCLCVLCVCLGLRVYKEKAKRQLMVGWQSSRSEEGPPESWSRTQASTTHRTPGPKGRGRKRK